MIRDPTGIFAPLYDPNLRLLLIHRQSYSQGLDMPEGCCNQTGCPSSGEVIQGREINYSGCSSDR